MRGLILAALLALGCFRVPAQSTVPDALRAAAPSPARVAQCRALERQHDTLAVSSGIVGAAGTATGGVAAALTGTAHTLLLAGGPVLGGVAAALLILATNRASDLAAEGCAQVLAAAEAP